MTARQPLNRRLHTALDRLAWGMGDAKRALLEKGLWPATATLLTTHNGAFFQTLGTRLRPSRSGKANAQGLLIPSQDCLWGSLELPDITRHQLPAALAEALWRISPLPPEKIHCAWQAQPQPQGGWQVHWGISRRDLAEQNRATLGLPETAPLYLERNPRQALPVTGQTTLLRRQRWFDALGLVLLGLLISALTLPALIPLALKRQDIIHALQHVQKIEPQAAPLRAQLDELRQQAELVQSLHATAQQAGAPLASALTALTQALPDDTWLDKIDLSGKDIRLSGITSNAADLLSHLGRDNHFADARASSASVRDSSLNKERFTFELRWRDPPPAPAAQANQPPPPPQPAAAQGQTP